ncbi:MAG: phage tail protein [Methanoregula sp.]|jgi:microcystin-dependent protein
MKKIFSGIFILAGILTAVMFLVAWTAAPDLHEAQPIGSIFIWPSNVTPEGCIMAYGQSVSQTQYNELYAVTGTTYGTGSGAGQFNVPDLRGIFVKGAGKTTRTAGVDANGTSYSIGLGVYAQDHFQKHGHAMSFSLSSTGITIPIYGASTGSAEQVSTGSPLAVGPGGDPRTAYLTEPQCLGLNYAIRAKHTFTVYGH